MRKFAIGSGLTILAAATPTQVFANPNVDTPAGVTEAGAIRIEEPAPNSGTGYKPQDKEGGLVRQEFKGSNAAASSSGTAADQPSLTPEKPTNYSSDYLLKTQSEGPTAQTKQASQRSNSRRRTKKSGVFKF